MLPEANARTYIRILALLAGITILCSYLVVVKQFMSGQDDICVKVPMNQTMLKKRASQTTITVEIKGRLGNHLFKLASLQGIAKTNGLKVAFPSKLLYLYKIFNLRPGLKKSVLTSSHIQYAHFRCSNSVSYDRKTEELLKHVCPRDNIQLQGFYQSFKYFEHMENDIRKQYTFKDKILENVNSYLALNIPIHLQKKVVTFVGIHIRRGDFLQGRLQRRGMVTATPDFVNKAKDLMRKLYGNVLFIATGDDKGWIRKYIMDNSTVVSALDTPEMDLALLASCNHTIISSGTFSWWAGWLSKGTTIYYSQYPRPGSGLARGFRTENYYPAHWIPLS